MARTRSPMKSATPTSSRASVSAPAIQGRKKVSPNPRLQVRGNAPLRGSSRPLRAMVRVFTDTGLRLGEVLPLRREDVDGETLQVRRTAHEGRILEGTKTDHGEPDAGRVVPVPATLAWMLVAQIRLNGGDCELLFTTPKGRLWRERTFYRDLWKPAQEASGLDIRPHECRHSYVTQLRAANVNDADLADIAGHRIETMLAHYIHSTGQSFNAVRDAVG